MKKRDQVIVIQRERQQKHRFSGNKRVVPCPPLVSTELYVNPDMKKRKSSTRDADKLGCGVDEPLVRTIRKCFRAPSACSR